MPELDEDGSGNGLEPSAYHVHYILKTYGINNKNELLTFLASNLLLGVQLSQFEMPEDQLDGCSIIGVGP